MRKFLQGRLERLFEALHRRARVRALARLDARTLKDIGLEPWQGELGARIWSHRIGMF